MNIKDFRTTIAALHKAFGVEATEASYDGYLMGLADLSVDDLQRAVLLAIRERSVLPKPYDIRKLIGKSSSSEDRAVAAWNDVQRALRHGCYKTIDFQDKVCNAVIRNLGGWPNFCSRFSGAEEEKWVRQEFLKAYQSFAASGISAELAKPVPGLSEEEVVDGKLVAPVPRLIRCEPERAKLSEQSVRSIGVSSSIVKLIGESGG
jgi:hypothetical protein